MTTEQAASVLPHLTGSFRSVRTATPVPAPGSSAHVEVEGHAIAVFNVGGNLYGIDSACPHRGCPLEKGRAESGQVVCPWHRLSFDLTTGAVAGGPGLLRRMSKPVTPYRVESAGGFVTVLLPPSPRTVDSRDPVPGLTPALAA